jgi:3'-phosphoadenosine 5'-phosphosulfate (PAPS) 3'-phosphatase
MSSRYDQELAVAERAAREAGAVVLDLYNRSAAATYTKADGSPVTDADLASDKIIRRILGEAFPNDALLTEEGADDPGRLVAPRVWIVDPIDGTQQFVNRTGQFDVLIALAVFGRPVVGVIYQPTTDTLTSAAEGGGAWMTVQGERHRLTFTPVPADAPPRLLTAHWFGSPGNLPLLQRTADRLGGGTPIEHYVGLTIRHFAPPGNPADALVGTITDGNLMAGGEWDIAAPGVVIQEAGGLLTDAWGRPHAFNKPKPGIDGGLLASVDPVTHRRIVEALGVEIPEPA